MAGAKDKAMLKKEQQGKPDQMRCSYCGAKIVEGQKCWRCHKKPETKGRRGNDGLQRRMRIKRGLKK